MSDSDPSTVRNTVHTIFLFITGAFTSLISQIAVPLVAADDGLRAYFIVSVILAVLVLVIPPMVSNDRGNPLRVTLVGYMAGVSYFLLIWLLEVAYVSRRDLSCPLSNLLLTVPFYRRPPHCPIDTPPGHSFNWEHFWQHFLTGSAIILIPSALYHTYADSMGGELIAPLNGVFTFFSALMEYIGRVVQVAGLLLEVLGLLLTVLRLLWASPPVPTSVQGLRSPSFHLPRLHLPRLCLPRLGRAEVAPEPGATTPPEILTTYPSASDADAVELHDTTIASLGRSGRGCGRTNRGSGAAKKRGERSGACNDDEGTGDDDNDDNEGAGSGDDPGSEICKSPPPAYQLFDADKPYSFV
ncbi:hypothetical protein EIP91_004393 [Steccherinum ochraceum]|uniref:Uncharacterized protein n=1 Tax=Steccherinum ochraceum TaxID=92696 RepID=A0A4R0RSE1_9APHY|nr:hypothetical protein EIP91_004393 [Steccherinum ochraceum]